MNECEMKVTDCAALSGSKLYVNKVDTKHCMIPQCIQSHRHSRLCSRVSWRVREGEPSRTSLRKVMHLYKCRRLRKMHSKMIKKTVPLSSVLHSIATNFKH